MDAPGATAGLHAQYGPDGTQFLPPNQNIVDTVDPNGNEVIYDNSSSDNYVEDTLGRQVTIGSNGSAVSVPDSRTLTESYGLQFTSVTVNTAFGQSGVTEDSEILSPYAAVNLPDGSHYQFQYDSYGELTSITLPTGGQVTYGYTNFVDAYGNVNRWVTTRTSGAGTWAYTPQVISTCPSGQQGCQQKVTVQKPSGDSVVYTFTMNGGAWPVEAQYYDHSGVLLATSTRDYDFSQACQGCSGAAYVRPTRDTDILPGSGGATLTRKREYTYDNPQFGNVTAIKEWGFYTGTPNALPDRETDTVFQTSSAYVNSNLLRLPLSVVIKDSGGTQLSKTLYSYDSSPLVSVLGVVHHNDTNYGPSNAIRGNLTSVQRWISGNTYLDTTTTYDTTGQPVSIADPVGNVTSFGYANNFYFDNGANPPYPSGLPAAAGNAYVSSITLPLIGTETIGYYYGSGKQALVTDQNGQTSYSHYNDPLDRQTEQLSAAGGWSLSTYTSLTETDTYTGINDTQPSASCVSCTHSQSLRDGLGRPSRSVLASDPDGQTYTDTAYDTNGRTATVSNPYRSTTDPTYGVTTSGFDGLDRVVQTTKPNGNVVQNLYGSSISSTQACSASTYGVGYPSQHIDEVQNKRQYWIDGFGRLIEVDEPNSSGILNVATCYKYDALGNLLQVVQQGETRSYSYDGISRLTQSITPEEGTRNFYYTTSSGGLCAGNPSLVCRQADARGITTTSSYDALNRLTQTTYSDGTPTHTFTYDQSTLWGKTLTNAKGRLTHEVVSGSKSERIFSYDPVGRILLQSECLPSNCGVSGYSTTATYNVGGSLATLSYPSGRKVSNTYTNAGRIGSVALTQVDGQSISYSYASGLTYSPGGAATNITYDDAASNALQEVYAYNSRLQLTSDTLSSSAGTFMQKAFTLADSSGRDNGDVFSVVDQLNAARTQTFTYDPLNRLSTAAETNWALSYGYDVYGNLLQQTVTAGSAPQLNLTVNTKNQIAGTGFSYDAAGNLTGDGTHNYAYDALNKLKTLDSTVASYTYDTDGLRVRKTVGSNWTQYIRFGGSVIAEVNQAGDWSDYIFLGSRRLARAQDLDTGLHAYGTKNGSTQWVVQYFNGAAGLTNYTIRSWDKLFFTQYQNTGSKGGVVLNFTDSTSSNFKVKDKEGYYLNDDQTQATTHFRTVDLSSLAGKIISKVGLNQETDTTNGAWAIVYEQIALISVDGTVHPIYTGQASTPINSVTQSGGETGIGTQIDINRGHGMTPQQTTSYFHSDHIGSSRLLTSGNAYPIWQGVYLPFGYEYNPQLEVDHYKFTGYEHDDESGLENANARQLSSQLARFASPDPIGGSLADPQSLNRYTYVANNPENSDDPSGMKSISDWRDELGGGGGGLAGLYISAMTTADYFNGGTIDGLDATSGMIGAALSSGSAVQCPNNNCDSGGPAPFQCLGNSCGYMTTQYATGHEYECDGAPCTAQEYQQYVKPYVDSIGSKITGLLSDGTGKSVDPLSPADPTLRGGNANFNVSGDLVSAYTSNDANGCIQSGDQFRCGGLDGSLHFEPIKDDPGSFVVHLDSANPLANGPLGLLEHFGIDVVGGNTIYQNGVPH